MKLFRTSSTEVVNSVKNILLLKSLVYCGQSVLTNLKTNLRILTIFSIKICCNLLAYTAYCHVVMSPLHVFTSVCYLLVDC